MTTGHKILMGTISGFVERRTYWQEQEIVSLGSYLRSLKSGPPNSRTK